EPDVYWRKARVSSGRFDSTHSWDCTFEIRSVANQLSALSSGSCADNFSASDLINDVVSTSDGWASLSIDRNLGRARSGRAKLGGYTGTAVTPAYMQP